MACARVRFALLLGSLLACGNLANAVDETPPPGDDAGPVEGGYLLPDGTAGDAPSESAPDADAQTVRCDVDLPFGPATVIAELDGATSARAYGSTIVASIPQGAEADVVEGAAGATLGSFSPLITGASVDTMPAPCTGALCLFWEHADTTGAKTEIWSATRMTAGGALNGSAAVTLPIPSVVHTHDPWVVANGDVFYFTSEENTTIDVWRASKTGSTYDAVQVAGLATGLPQSSAVLTDDERTIFFARTVATGDDDVFVASRPDPSQPFADVIRVDAASVSGKRDRPTWVSADGCVLWVASNRDGSPKIYRLAKN